MIKLSELPIPTDNLYKFIAISGLIIFAMSLIIPFYGSYIFQSKSIELSTEINLLDTKSGFLDRDLINVGNKIADLEKDKLKMTSQILSAHNKSIEDFRSIELAAVEIEGKKELQQYYLTSLKKLRYIAWVGQAVGLMFSIYGFRLWYTRLQKPLDLELAESIKRNK